MMRVHLGCGKRHIPGFVHVDHQSFPHVDHCRDVRDLGCFESGTVHLLYACHVFEYFDRQDAPAVLAEWRRTLAPGGILRLSVPDFAVAVRLYQAGLPMEWFLGPLYGRILGADPGHVIYHKTAYDRASLTAVLSAAGFERCEPWDWRATDHADVDDFSQAYFPHMEKDRGVLCSLNLQAYAPAAADRER
jgi:hypothetical protein